MSDEGDLYGGEINQVVDANYALTDIVSPALNLHFARDAMGDIVALGNAAGANPATETYSYDALYRLTSLSDANGNLEEAYTYSKTGDRLSKTASGLDTGVYSYQSGTHHLISIGNASRVYDANGNTTGSVVGGNTYGFGYNGRNRMTVAQLNGSTVGTYTYNVLGQRTAKIAAIPTATNQRFVYDENSQLLSEYGSDTRDYIWLDGVPVATVDTTGGASAVSYVTADGLNTPRAVSDSNGNTIWQLAYQGNPFGEQQPISPNGYTLNMRFPGQYYDAESGLIHNGYRDYDAGRGGYEQADPLGPAGGPNPYAYVGGNPLSRVDPLGLWSVSFEAYGILGGAVTIGQDPTSGQWFYGGRLGAGLSVGGSFDPNGKRPGADQDKNKDPCDHGTTVGTFAQVNASFGVFGWNPVQAAAGVELGNTDNDYHEGPAPADTATFNKVDFSIGASIGFEVFGH